MVEANDGRFSCDLCGAVHHRLRARYTAPPAGETDFGIADYRRDLWECEGCGHFVNRCGFDLAANLYGGAYAQATYGDRMRANFQKIMALPADRSDNRQRVARIGRHMAGVGRAPGRLLDVGAGLGVFPAAMREAGWECTALDPDPQACALIGELAGVETLCSDFMVAAPSARFDLITFNKVLEHVAPMTAMLARARDFLAEDGIVYVELPDGEEAVKDSPDREEFFVEHLCAFSLASFALFVTRAGFTATLIERLREPSGKYTLRAFLT